MKLRELMIESENHPYYNNVVDVELYRQKSLRINNKFHTDCIEFITSNLLGKTDAYLDREVIDYEYMDEDEYNNKINANNCIQDDFEYLYENDDAIVLCVILEGGTEEESFFTTKKTMTVKEARHFAGISQVKMEEVMEIPLQIIQDWEDGQNTPPPYVEKMVVEKLRRMAIYEALNDFCDSCMRNEVTHEDCYNEFIAGEDFSVDEKRYIGDEIIVMYFANQCL